MGVLPRFWSKLGKAVKLGHAEVVRVLMRQGIADPRELTNWQGSSAIDLVVSSGHTGIMEVGSPHHQH